MTKTQAQILELFQTLPQSEQHDLAEQLYEQAARGSFYDRMTPDQRAALTTSIAEADRDEGTEASVVMNRIALKCGFSRTA